MTTEFETKTTHVAAASRRAFLGRIAGLGGAALVAGGLPGLALADERGRIRLRDITTPIVPTRQTTRGADRDFDGNGPIITLGVELFPGRNGRAVFARVIMSARERGGDGSATSIGPLTFEVWRWRPSDGARFVRQIVSRPVTTMRHVSGRGCVGCAQPGRSADGRTFPEDGGMVVTVANRFGGPVREVTLLGDTAGDDISRDRNPHGDTSIRRISFHEVDVIFTDRLVRR